MKILIIGSGAREHALCWKIAQSPLLTKLYCAPGNAGIAEQAEIVPIAANDLPGLLQFARKEQIDLTIVGPEEPLCLGIVDLFEKEKLKIFGPDQRAAELEGSKTFCKELLQRHKIPTAAFRRFENSAPALSYLESLEYPVVVKASGLAAGKGVSVCADLQSARNAVLDAMEKKVFGKAGESILIEEFLRGQEMSLLILTDGQTVIPLEPAQDYKAVLDGGKGPNTGGMGSICPPPTATPRLLRQIESQIVIPTIHALNREGRRFRGVLYAGLMLCESGPKVLEFNVRFGDPETQALMMRLRSDLLPYFLHAAEGKLDTLQGIEWDPRPSICVVAASKGYPGNYEKGKVISGLNEVTSSKELAVFHAGTTRKEKQIVSAGGRVLSVAAVADSIPLAREKAYEQLRKIQFDGVHWRSDIGL